MQCNCLVIILRSHTFHMMHQQLFCVVMRSVRHICAAACKYHLSGICIKKKIGGGGVVGLRLWRMMDNDFPCDRWWLFFCSVFMNATQTVLQLQILAQHISQQLIHKPMIIFALRHKSYSVVHYFSNPPRHSIDVSAQHSHRLLWPLIHLFDENNFKKLYTKSTIDSTGHMSSEYEILAW